jgi:Holliday junction resolvasome RuvABC endonuclease subunit
VIERIIAFDPGSRVTGWCLLLHGEYSESGVFACQEGDFQERRHQIRQQVSETLLRLTTEEGDIDILACEEPMSRSIDTKAKLVTIAADIENAGMTLGIPYMDGRVMPYEWHQEAKAASQCDGVANIKAHALATAIAVTGRTTMQQDEADAFWIAKFVAHNARRGA